MLQVQVFLTVTCRGHRCSVFARQEREIRGRGEQGCRCTPCHPPNGAPIIITIIIPDLKSGTLSSIKSISAKHAIGRPSDTGRIQYMIISEILSNNIAVVWRNGIILYRLKKRTPRRSWSQVWLYQPIDDDLYKSSTNV